MLTSHVKFHSVNGKRQILIVDDEQVNRELLGYIAASNFDVLYASDGVSALKLMEENAHTLSLVLLDLNMPEMDGFQVMSKMMENEALKNLPVLVMTSEEDAEIDARMRAEYEEWLSRQQSDDDLKGIDMESECIGGYIYDHQIAPERCF